MNRWSTRSRAGARKSKAAPATWIKIITGTLLPELSKEILGKMVDGQPIDRVTVKANAAGVFAYEVG